MNRYAPLQARFGADFALGESLARHTAARLGGPATACLRAKNTAALRWAARWAASEGVAWRVLGGGANVLIADAGFDGLIILNQTKDSRFDLATGHVWAESGVGLTALARQCMGRGLGGLEWAVSVPGTIGGAVVNNAGAHGGDMAHDLLSAQVYDAWDDKTDAWENAAFAYAYRHSALKGLPPRYVVLSATLTLQTGQDPAHLQARAEGFIAQRKRTQPTGASLGSMFKNPPNDYAGRLLEAAGLKGRQIGGVQISPVHANFFVNVGGGTASDYAALIRLAQETVQAQFGVWLELEVEQIGA